MDGAGAGATTGTAALRLNADIRDIVAEFAVGSCATFAALRGTSRCWRLAVDRQVRMLVASRQPQLAPWNRELSVEPPLPPLVLDAGDNCATLDRLRFAFRRDGARAVLRLAIVAFGLDGPKDPEQEVGWCGPRPLSILGFDSPDSAVLGCTVVDDDEEPLLSYFMKQPAIARTARRSLAVTDPECPLSIAPHALPFLEEAMAHGMLADVTAVDITWGDQDTCACGAFAQRLSSRLESVNFRIGFTNCLDVPDAVVDFARSLPRASRIAFTAPWEYVMPYRDGHGPRVNASLAKILSAVEEGRSPVETLIVDSTTGVIADVVAGFVRRVPSVCRIIAGGGDALANLQNQLTDLLPPDTRARLVHFEIEEHGDDEDLRRSGYTGLRGVEVRSDRLREWGPDNGWTESVEVLVAYAIPAHPFPIDTNFAALFPKLRSLDLSMVFSPASLSTFTPRLPPTLEELRLCFVSGVAVFLRSSLERNACPRLRKVVLLDVDDATGAVLAADTIEDLTVDGCGAGTAELVAACSKRLVSLDVDLPSDLRAVTEFPCLRRLTVRNGGPDFAALVKLLERPGACPQLHYVKVPGGSDELASALNRAEWAVSVRGHSAVVACRHPFVCLEDPE